MPAPRHIRHRFPAFAALAAFTAGLVAVAGLALAQPPKPGEEEEDPKAKSVKKKVVTEEEEDPKAKAKKKVPTDDVPPPPVKPKTPDVPPPPATSPADRLDEVARAAAAAADEAAKAALELHVVPFDRITEAGTPVRVQPLPVHRSDPRFRQQAFTAVPLDAESKPLEARSVEPNKVGKVEHFEEIVLAEADALAKAGGGDRLAAADTLLAGALRFHTWAVANGKRRGKGWDELKVKITDRQKDLHRQTLKAAVALSDWPRVREVGAKLAADHAKDPAVAAEVAAAWLAEADPLLKSSAVADLERAREVVRSFQEKFPGAGGDAAKRVKERLTAEAKRYLESARAEAARKNVNAARDQLLAAARLDPELPGLRDLQGQLRSGYPVVTVGVTRLPERMSPATARFDSEVWATELLFEGLTREVTDENGLSRYVPAAAADLPAALAGGREFFVRRGAAWGLPDNSALDAFDVANTLKLYRNKPDSWAAAPAEWFDERAAVDGPGHGRLFLKTGHPDPRALLTFKILPARHLLDRGKTAADPDFARRPFGTGPFRLAPATPKPGEAARLVTFTDNPAYAAGQGRTGQPALREIIMTDITKLADPVTEIRADRLHVIPDLPTADLDGYENPTGPLANKVTVVTPPANRRVHILAVNHRRQAGQSKDLRAAVLRAIDREAILNEVYRAGKKYHTAMTGPFPPKAWATPQPAAPAPLFNRDLAAAKLTKYLAGGGKQDVILIYPADDPRGQRVCERVRQQLEALLPEPVSGRRLQVVLEGAPPREFWGRLEDEQRYDLAYVPFDYPDDWFPLGLGTFLDPTAADPGGRNYLGYLSPASTPDADDVLFRQKLAEVRMYRNFAGEVLPRTHELHRLFNDAAPFVPLWQLDRHMVFHNALKVAADDTPAETGPRALNPTALFQGVARWRLE